MMLSRTDVLRLAWPIVLAQAATAVTGVVDTVVMGRVGLKEDLAAVAIASVAFSFVYWAFGFLRMSTTGLVAQARGAGEDAESNTVLHRGLLAGLAIGLLLAAGWPLIRWVIIQLFSADADVEQLARGYLNARIFGAPAALMGYAVMGWLIGTGRTRLLLAFQVVLNLVNAALDATFVIQFDMGPTGIGAGTAIAEWVALFFGLWLVRGTFSKTTELWDRERIVAMFSANRDIMVRTLALLFAFAWFTNGGAKLGTAELAGNQVLLQFIAVSAFVLDAFAFVAEKEVGEALGSGSESRLNQAIFRTSELAMASGIAFSLVFYLAGEPIIASFVKDELARSAAIEWLPWCAAVPAIGFAAFQLDGIFIGATQGKALRNAAIASTALYIALDFALRPAFGNTGLWAAFLGWYVLRAAFLAFGLPGLFQRVRKLGNTEGEGS